MTAVQAALLAAFFTFSPPARAEAPKPAKQPAWAEPMRQVHARFTGTPGTFAHFGDSITVSMAFWASLRWEAKGMDAETDKDYDLVKKYMKPECWNQWKGPDYGNEGSMTIRWAHGNVDRWLRKLNPEVVLIMFGSNDVGQVPVQEYRQKTAEVVERCLKNGSVVILSTLPPRSGLLNQCRPFADAVRHIVRDKQIPLVDYFEEIRKRRPDDWDGALPKFKGTPGGVYEVPTLISGDGVHPSNPRKYKDYSQESLRNNGFLLRNYLTLRAYADVVRAVLTPTTPGPPRRE
jgi:lysophospholipase L1-like esterase